MRERAARRLEWSYPEGTHVVAEYWLETLDPAAFVVFETDSIQHIWAVIASWADLVDVAVYPAIRAEEGLELLRQQHGG
jgi:hypothetical protein